MVQLAPSSIGNTLLRDSYPEHTFDVIAGRGFLNWRFRVPTQEIIDGIYNLEHFATCDNSISIDIIQPECPGQFIVLTAVSECG